MAETIIKQAVVSRATDIHILPKAEHSQVLFRLTYKLIPKINLTLEESERLISYLKFQASMDIGEKRRPQNGSFSIEVDKQIIGLRLSTLPSTYSESLVIRILPQEDYIPFHRLSLFPKSTRILLSMIKFSHGLIIFTGPTGSGKTTTLYSLLQHSTKFHGRNVITLEDPVEKSSEDLLQVQVNEKAGITYSTGLKAILRHDPDIIMVGEIRDSETAKIAVRASLTGHLVLTTMHTRNAKGALYRLMEFGVNWSEMEQTLVAITAQRLVEVLCPYCLSEDCPIYCSHHKENRAAVYEILYGSALQEALMELKGYTMQRKYPTLKQVISKGIALGFIKETEYERWVLDSAQETLEYT
ncbi:competence type IV pilus ATPase ComGA [Caldibacillus lycopersici]|uniref:Competence type IV pilus ATPase ComGA n=1 Tax=Perspicuibacillus lycopersici TaxID=1325689 RepID=A0AAE3ITG0_9BACI|nr:competence type IV pilus ATPase ComGA [Perspicuibacillus lycopersici]MCU9613862.1 competence type IV pilus ATPase ComGA [Perspicuibacillus lycopersici]